MASIEKSNEFCTEKPEVRLSRLFREELGVDIPAQSLRLFVRYHWRLLSPLAHRIHDKAGG
jgi:hypothetical protein